MTGKHWYKSKTMLFNMIIVILYGALYLAHPQPEQLHIESFVAAITSITNILLRLQTKEPIK